MSLSQTIRFAKQNESFHTRGAVFVPGVCENYIWEVVCVVYLSGYFQPDVEAL